LPVSHRITAICLEFKLSTRKNFNTQEKTMTILRSGTTKKYSDNWAAAFGGTKKKSTKKSGVKASKKTKTKKKSKRKK